MILNLVSQGCQALRQGSVAQCPESLPGGKGGIDKDRSVAIKERLANVFPDDGGGEEVDVGPVDDVAEEQFGEDAAGITEEELEGDVEG